jgi:hypothetical protein
LYHPGSLGVDLTFGDLDLFSWTSGSVLLDRWIFLAGIYIVRLVNTDMRKGNDTHELKSKGSYPAFSSETDKMDERPRATDRF